LKKGGKKWEGRNKSKKRRKEVPTKRARRDG